jgi:lipoprotein NlpD
MLLPLDMKTRPLPLLVCAMLVVLVAGCQTSAPRPAPVVERGSAATGTKAATRKPGVADTRPEFYTVRKGDTLHSIALDQGLDYRDLAAWNGITDPNRIAVDQQLRLRPPGSPPAAGVEAATVAPLATVPPPAEGKPLVPEAKPQTPPPGLTRPAGAAPSAALVKTPKAQRLPYSDEALAQLKGAPSPFAAPAVIAAASAATPRPAGPEAAKQEAPRTEPPKPELAKVDPKPETTPEPQAGDDEDRVAWSWPANGKVVTSFSEAANLKGIGIGGKAGQPVLASAGGKVVYAGSGLRGYGKLVIIKHNKTYLSVYAHNSEILVKEGQTVAKGQKIAEMGNTDADQVKLHFEIRRLGKPVDPLRYLPSGKG